VLGKCGVLAKSIEKIAVCRLRRSIAASKFHLVCRLGVIHDRCTPYPCRSMSVVTPIAPLLFGAAQ
jgi:hypothetical protein